MRFTNKALTLILLLGSYVSVLPAELKRHYITDDGQMFFEEVIPISLEQIDRARNAKESLPASEYPEGNWGPVVEGFQLSIRLEKEAFTNDEPIIATILLRNASDRHLKYPVFTPRDFQGTVMLWKGGERLYGKDEPKPGGGFLENLKAVRAGKTIYWPSPVGTQRKFTVNLTETFALATNGQYVVQATRKVPAMDGSRSTNVVSGKASFTAYSTGPRTNIEKLSAQQPTTNSFPTNLFLTDDGRLFRYRSGEKLVETRRIKEAEKLEESLPADQDPKGHWGKEVDGFQLSLRFEKPEYTNRESVVATVLIRNVSDKPQKYSRVVVGNRPCPVNILAWRGEERLEPKAAGGTLDVISADPVPIQPRTQHKYRVALEQFYDLAKPGTYFFQAEYKSPALKETGPRELDSEKVKVVISAP